MYYAVAAAALAEVGNIAGWWGHQASTSQQPEPKGLPAPRNRKFSFAPPTRAERNAIPTHPIDLLPLFVEAAKTVRGLSWRVLAAISFEETHFGQANPSQKTAIPQGTPIPPDPNNPPGATDPDTPIMGWMRTTIEQYVPAPDARMPLTPKLEIEAVARYLEAEIPDPAQRSNPYQVAVAMKTVSTDATANRLISAVDSKFTSLTGLAPLQQI